MSLAFVSALPITPLRLLRIIAVIVLTLLLVRQVRKPSRWLGRPFLWLMNFSHSRMTDWGLEHVQIGKDFCILDVGCGGGRTIQKLAQITNGKVYGVDYAKGSVAASRAKNAALIAEGRCEVLEGSVSKLPFAENMFDLVTAVETQYYWPDLVNDMQEIRRVLKPGAKLIILAEVYSGGNESYLERMLMKSLGSGFLSPVQQHELFEKTGYTNIEVSEGKNKKWICVVGQKAAV